MKLARIGAPGVEVPVVLENGKYYSLESMTKDINAEFWETDGFARTVEAVASGSLPEFAVEDRRLGSPIARPSSVFCIGMNYAAHAAESGSTPPQCRSSFTRHRTPLLGRTTQWRFPVVR